MTEELTSMQDQIKKMQEDMYKILQVTNFI